MPTSPPAPLSTNNNSPLAAPSGWVGRMWQIGQRLARSPYAHLSLIVTSASEAILSPLPPDVVLAPLAATHPQRTQQFVIATTIASVGGALIGYWIGWIAYPSIGEPLLTRVGAVQHVPLVQSWFAQYTSAVMFVAAFTPIPFKVFTIVAGALNAPLLPFLVASFVGRFLRFWIVARVAARYGLAVALTLEQRSGVALLLVGVALIFLLVWLGL